MRIRSVVAAFLFVLCAAGAAHASNSGVVTFLDAGLGLARYYDGLAGVSSVIVEVVDADLSGSVEVLLE